MDRGQAYKLLAGRLNDLRTAGYGVLLSRVDQPATIETVHVDGEPIGLEIQVSWSSRKRGELCISATAAGPSTWMTQRLEESFIIGPDVDAGGC
jgi:hypothetical protein